MEGKKFIIDRIESNLVVLEDDYENIIVVEKNSIKGETKEGYVVIKSKDSFIVDIKATRDRKNKIDALMKGMWED